MKVVFRSTLTIETVRNMGDTFLVSQLLGLSSAGDKELMTIEL